MPPKPPGLMLALLLLPASWIRDASSELGAKLMPPRDVRLPGEGSLLLPCLLLRRLLPRLDDREGDPFCFCEDEPIEGRVTGDPGNASDDDDRVEEPDGNRAELLSGNAAAPPPGESKESLLSKSSSPEGGVIK